LPAELERRETRLQKIKEAKRVLPEGMSLFRIAQPRKLPVRIYKSETPESLQSAIQALPTALTMTRLRALQPLNRVD
jgi:hypothetical protein